MDTKALFVSLLFMGIFVLVPVLLIMTEHQRKMAKIIHGKNENSDELLQEVKALRNEVAALRGVPPPAQRPPIQGSVESDRSDGLSLKALGIER